MGRGSAAGHHGVMNSTAVNRRALLGLVALGGACAGLRVLRRARIGPCPRSRTDPSAETRILTDPGEVDGRMWQAATTARWRTNTGLRFTGALNERYLDYDGPEKVGSSQRDFAGLPGMVHEDEDCLVVQAGSGVCALERADGRVRWTVELDAPAQGLIAGGVSRGLVWTNAGALDLRTGEVQAVPGTVSRAVNLLAGEGVVVAVVPDEDDADRGELVCLESRDCSQRWSTGIDDPGPSSVRLTGDNSIGIGLRYYDLDSGECTQAVADVAPPAPREGADQRLESAPQYVPPVPREGVFVVVDTDVGRSVRVVVDDDGTAVAVRAFAPQERMNDAGYREEHTSGEELWSVPLEARPGAVVAIDSALGEQGSSFWVMDLDDSGALHLAHWKPGPA